MAQEQVKPNLERVGSGDTGQKRIPIPTTRKYQAVRRVLEDDLGIQYLDQIDQQVLDQLATFKGIGPTKLNALIDLLTGQEQLPVERHEVRKASPIPVVTQTYYPEILLGGLAALLPAAETQGALKALTNVTVATELVTILKRAQVKSGQAKKLVAAWQQEVGTYEAWRATHHQQTMTFPNSASQVPLLHLQVPFSETTVLVDATVQEGPQEVANEVAYRLTTLDERFAHFEAAFQTDVTDGSHWADILQLEQTLVDPTLAEIGQQIGLTRERVRQIKARINGARDFWSQIYQIQTTIALRDVVPQSAVTLAELSPAVRTQIAPLETPMLTIGQLPLLITPTLSPEMRRQLIRLDAQLTVTDNGFTVKRLDFLGELITDFQTKKSALITAIQRQYGFTYSLGDTLYKRPLTDRAYFLKLGTDHPAMIFSGDAAGIAQLKTIFEQQFHRELFRKPVKNEIRTLVSKLFHLVDANEFTYLGDNQFKLADHDKLSPELCNRIAKTLNERLAVAPEVSVTSLYHQFEHDARRAGLINRYEFYYELRYFFKGEFEFGHKNTMNIRKAGTETVSLQASLEQYLRQNQNYARVEDVCQAFGWPDYTLAQTAFFAPDVNIHDNWVLLQTFTLPDELVAYLQRLIALQVAQHPDYLLVTDLRKQLLVEDHWRQLLQTTLADTPFATKYLTETTYFADIVTRVDARWHGHAFVKYLTKKFDDGQLILDHFRQPVLSRQVISEFYHELGYQDSSIYVILQRLQAHQELIAVGNNQFVTAQALQQWVAVPELSERVNRYLGKRLSFSDERAYLPLASQVIDTTTLPALTHLDWTPELLSYVATQGPYYRQLAWAETATNVLPADPVIMVRQASQWTTIDELVRGLMATYTGNWTLPNVVQYLKQRGILTNMKTTRLPSILSETLTVDEAQMVHLV
ncbi:sigma factor-like helix-turn-helix DNA-binding protein [Levilactobacillus acidifarinae]|uniref:RNA polymerase sigma-70 region 4 domain-containing protein n=1 Tax=Levilactobacillus acidifarinae DSM 19394 = JCM 15949 TaxID=1423715 RepID=A0A0R1LK08_9LACO|nr:sigma factor-like helix-turn-helix DNA-binding protein [Levilactobacillus acidifarinae]KRK96246.1 hypothetical protein FD25_GL002715 [Levilactobacillus acidifarinae DSM 19394]GEO69610.1 hypothetical protein LAC03_15200 [Levilactobacillus acidifarinae]